MSITASRQRRRARGLLSTLGGLSSLALLLFESGLASAALRGQVPPPQQQQEEARGDEIDLSHHRHLNVYGFPDRRKKADPFSHPGRTIGKLQFPDGMYCTGTLTGEQYVLTARHCFTDDNQQILLERMRGTFQAGYNHGQSLAESAFQHVWYSSGVDDWAIIRLQEPLGIDLGYLTVRNVTDPMELVGQEPSYKMYAYSNDKYAFTLGVDPQCALLQYVVSVDNGAEMYMTSCSGEAGSSGAAILDQDNHVVGVFTAAVDSVSLPRVRVIGDFNIRHPNFAVPSSTFFDKYMSLPNIAQDSDEEFVDEEVTYEEEDEGGENGSATAVAVTGIGEASQVKGEGVGTTIEPSSGNLIQPEAGTTTITTKIGNSKIAPGLNTIATVIPGPSSPREGKKGGTPTTINPSTSTHHNKHYLNNNNGPSIGRRAPVFNPVTGPPIIETKTPAGITHPPAPQGPLTGLNNNYSPSPDSTPDVNAPDITLPGGQQADYSYGIVPVVRLPPPPDARGPI